MAILTVGPTSTFPTIAAAMAAAGTGDIISLEAGYGNETATVTVDGLSFDGGPSSTGIVLQLAIGISSVTLLGTAPINVSDGSDANTIVGNGADNIITVSSGVDVVTAAGGTDRLVINYSAATAPITGTPTNVTDGGTHAVTFTGVENFTITTGSGDDTITVGDGFNILNTGLGNDTITAGNGQNIIDGGNDNDTITAGSGPNTINGGLGNDTIIAGGGGNTVDGGGGDDGITTGAGNDIVIAGLGNDTIITGAGTDVTTVNGGIDTVDSGSETDRLIVAFSSSTTAVNGGVTGGTLAGGYDGAFADVAGTSSVVFQGTENITVTTGSGNDVIATGDGADVLDGGAGSDQLNASGGSDVLLIGLGSDALDGGAGTDTVMFSGARRNYEVNDLGGGVIQTIDLRAGSPDGTDTLVNMEGFTFTDFTFDAVTVLIDPPGANTDLNGDGKGDILWQHEDGTAGVWFMDGLTLSSTSVVGINPGPKWDLIGAGDFDGDGKSDVLWQNDDGTPGVWFMDGATVLSTSTVGSAALWSPDWSVIDAGDFNGDGKADILWQNTMGGDNAPGIWLMDGTTVVAHSTVGSPALWSPDWDVIAAGDFNGDGKSDMLWQNHNGQAGVWLMDGLTVVATGAVGADPGPSAHAIDTGDFNGDGKYDILWQNDDGQASIWLMDGLNVLSAVNVGSNPGTAWNVIGANDLDGDGKAEILWQHDDGTAGAWLMDGTNVLATSTLGGNPGTRWDVIQPHDLLT